MESRREFIKSVSSLGVAGLVGAPAANSFAQAVSPAMVQGGERSYWLAVMDRISTPVLANLSRHQLKQQMPVEAANPAERRHFTHLEAFGRLLAGIAPWVAVQAADEAEARQQRRIIELTHAALDAATDPNSPDFMNFHQGSQPLVDTAFLVQGILRAPDVLWEPLSSRVQQQIIQALKSSREIATPDNSNWVMFAAMIETALLVMGEKTLEARLEDCVHRMLDWYDGDGVYGDGAFFHWDYYDSFVIHPMLVDVLAVLKEKGFEMVYAAELTRARRYAEIQERLIAPDATFPSIGRSTTYRFGALQSLAQISLRRQLPERVSPAQVRGALTAVIRKMIEAPGTFDAQGWLQIGFCGHQPSLAENYISTGSLYLCSAVFLPLGLPATDEFWSGPATPWTQQRLWSGQNLPADHAIHDIKKVMVPTLDRSS
jgi:hypothetical protein